MTESAAPRAERCPACFSTKAKIRLAIKIHGTLAPEHWMKCFHPFHEGHDASPAQETAPAVNNRLTDEEIAEMLRHWFKMQDDPYYPSDPKLLSVLLEVGARRAKELESGAHPSPAPGQADDDDVYAVPNYYNAEELAAHPLSRDPYPPILPSETEEERKAALFYASHPEFWIHPIAASAISGDKDRATIRVHKAMAAYLREAASPPAEPATPKCKDCDAILTDGKCLSCGWTEEGERTWLVKSVGKMRTYGI
jgi:hypothetical protein